MSARIVEPANTATSLPHEPVAGRTSHTAVDDERSSHRAGLPFAALVIGERAGCAAALSVRYSAMSERVFERANHCHGLFARGRPTRPCALGVTTDGEVLT